MNLDSADNHPGTPEERAVYWRGRAEAAWRREVEEGVRVIILRSDYDRLRSRIRGLRDEWYRKPGYTEAADALDEVLDVDH